MQTELAPLEIAAPREALEDEYRARATYDQVIRDFGPVRPFINIRESESRHIEALLVLFERYAVEAPQDDWPGRVERFVTVREACMAGVQAEVENGAMYERLMRSTSRPDILRVFERLCEASRARHLHAFRRCAERGSGSGREGGRGGGRIG